MRLITLALAGLCLITPAQAQEATPSASYGLAMHGTPKYSATDTHADYANPDAPKGGTLKQAAIGTFDTLNPYSIKGKAAQGLNYVYDRLMARMWDEPFTMYPLIAERAEVSNDRSEVTFYINPKARFHDGTPITQDDVLFSFETLRDSGRPNMRRIYRLITTAEKRSNNGVYFKLGEGYDRETLMILALMPVLSKAYWSGRVFDSTTLETPVLNGPYRIKSFDAGRQITYERVKDYWAANLLPNKGHNNFDEIIYEYYRDDTVALEALQAQEVNLRREWSVANWASAYNTQAVKDGRVTRYEPEHSRAARATALVFNMRRAPFDNHGVRRALSLAFDEEWVAKNIFYGKYKRAHSYFPNTPLAAPFTPDTRNLRTRLREADDLLAKAGWVVKDGKRVSAETGKPFSFEMLLGSAEDEKIALSYKKSLERLGIILNIRTLDMAGFQDRLNNYDYDMVSYFWQNSLSPGTEQMLYWSCEAAKQPSRWNYAGICREDVDALAGDIANAKTYEELTEKARALDKILIEQNIAIPLFYNSADYYAYWQPIEHPAKVPLYGSVIETWWTKQVDE